MWIKLNITYSFSWWSCEIMCWKFFLWPRNWRDAHSLSFWCQTFPETLNSRRFALPRFHGGDRDAAVTYDRPKLAVSAFARTCQVNFDRFNPVRLEAWQDKPVSAPKWSIAGIDSRPLYRGFARIKPRVTSFQYSAMICSYQSIGLYFHQVRMRHIRHRHDWLKRFITEQAVIARKAPAA